MNRVDFLNAVQTINSWMLIEQSEQTDIDGKMLTIAGED